jgi:protein-tyrosine phosphatase
MFEELLALEGEGFLINCAAGKDRTGFGAALILGALGVSEADIVQDYLLSERYYPLQREIGRIRRKYGPYLGENVELERIMPMLETRESYIRAALDTIRDDFGDIEAYLERALGIGPSERAQLRALYTA